VIDHTKPEAATNFSRLNRALQPHVVVACAWARIMSCSVSGLFTTFSKANLFLLDMGGQFRIITTSSTRSAGVRIPSECGIDNSTRSYCYFHRESSIFCCVLFARKSLRNDD
jgi:hypothetical protein